MISELPAESSRQMRHEAQRLEILEAAAIAIAEHGFHGMTMRGLARATNRGLATFYNYFSSKEEVLFSLQTEAFETMAASVNGLLKDITEPSDRLYVFVLNHLRFLAERRAVMRVLVHEASALPAGQRRTVRQLKEAYFKICRDIVAAILDQDCDPAAGNANLDPTEIERVTYSVFGMLNWSYGWYDARQHGTPQDVAKTIHALALCGLVGRRPLLPTTGNLDRCLGAKAAPVLPGWPGRGVAAAKRRVQATQDGGKRARAPKAFEQETV